MKYKVKKITILHNGKSYPEGSLIDLTKKDAQGLKQFLENCDKPEDDNKGDNDQ